MPTEKEKMLAGQLYDAGDPQLTQERKQARALLYRLNITEYGDEARYQEIIRLLLPNAGADIWVEPPFYCDYGYNIYTGQNVYFNFNCVLLDVMPIRIGSDVQFGPNVQIYTATHPVNYAERKKGPELARPITIGDDCWFGGSVVICPGVTVGPRTVIGAGSVITKDIPADVFAAGNPCRVVRRGINAG